MKHSLLFLITLLLFTSCQEIDENKPLMTNSHKKQPIFIVNKNRHFNMSEFWIDQLEYPQKEIMSSAQIKKFNNIIINNKETVNPFRNLKNYYKSRSIKEDILFSFEHIKEKATYFSDGNKISSKFYKDLKKYLNLNSLYTTNIIPKYALTINYCDQKTVPSDLLLLKKKNQIHFDRNQNSALDIATPIIVLHSTKDGLWHYGISPTSFGWVHSNDIAFGEKKEIQNYLDSKNFIVTTEPKTAVKIGGRYHDYVRMGVKLPFIMTIDNESMVMIPTADSSGKLIFSNATVKSSNVHKGYLNYTPENIITQAFKFLHLPYGWGGMYGEQDCSKFIQEVYATVGVILPRNSSSQSNASNNKIELLGVSKNSKETFLRNSAMAGGTILHLSGHIVLYLGEYKGEPYIIHTLWGNSKKHFALGRTAVTSLNFHDYLKKIDRLTNIKLK